MRAAEEGEAGPALKPLPLWFLQAVVVLLVGVKILHALVFPATEDEAYYWLWGQQLDFSYFDHAPLIGWMMRLFDELLGWNLVALRIGNFITLIGVALVFRHWAQRLAPENPGPVFWSTLAIYLSSPLIFGITSLAYPDAWLILFTLLSAHFFATSFAAQIDEGRLRIGSLYAGALFLGLAALAKYNAVLLGIGVALAILLTPKLRPLLRRIHLYLAALLSVAVLAPVLYWNALNDFISLRFQLYGRHASGAFDAIDWSGFIRFSIICVLFVSPFLWVPLIRMLTVRSRDGLLGALQRIARPTLVVTFAMMLWLALHVPTAPHWAVVALVVPIGVAVHFFWSRWLVLGHIVFGAIVSVAVAGYYMHYAFVNFGGDGEASRFYGWDQVGARMQALAAEQGAAPTLAAWRWEATSKLGFALETTDVTSLEPIIDQYDFWRDDAALAGQDLMIVDEYGIGPSGFAASFESVDVLDTVEIVLHGKPLRSYSILIGRGYRPVPQVAGPAR